MIDFQSYKNTLLSNGRNVAEVKKNQSDDIMNLTFKNDPTYKKVYVLTDEGWVWQDAKYQKHTTPSILKDNVDYYLQFRPKTHFKIGTYVIIPDDTSPEINTPENPFDQPVENRTQWWLIVGRTDANAFVRYSVLKCNYEFKWVYKGVIQNIYGCLRQQSSYNSGIWTDEISSTIDNITAAWIPDISFTYKNRELFNLCDNRTIGYGQRFMITNNIINPKVYRVTKILELVPEGVVKLTVEQTELDETTDNISLMICDYYDNSGKPLVSQPEPELPSDPLRILAIHWMLLSPDGYLDYNKSRIKNTLKIGEISYFKAEFSDDYESKILWDISVADPADNERKEYYVGLLKVTDFEDGSLSIKPSKANSLIGKKFKLTASDESGEYISSIELEVQSNET